MSSHQPVISIIADLVYMLGFGIALYSGSYTSSVDGKDIFGHGDIVEIDFQQVKLEQIQLNCLYKYVGAPVWVFSQIRKLPAETVEGYKGAEGARVLTSIRSLADLWGPARLIYSKESPEKVLRIDVERGTICQNGELGVSDPTYPPNTVSCHWFEWGEPVPGNLTPFDPHATLLIGATDEELWDFRVNDQCQKNSLGTALHNSSQEIILGASETKTSIDKHTVNIGLSKTVVANYSFDLKPRPGVKFKSLLAFHWAKENSNPDPRSLDLRLGLEISNHTGNAQRVALWELFQLENVKDYIRDVLPGPLERNRQSVQQDHTLSSFLDVFERGFERFLVTWRSNGGSRESSIEIIRGVIQNLLDTGRKCDNSLDAWNAPKALKGRRIWNSSPKRMFNWIQFVGVDNSCEASLCVISRRCLECHSSSGLKCSSQSKGSRSALRTAIHFDQRKSGGKLQKNLPKASGSRGFFRELFGHSYQDAQARQDALSDLSGPALQQMTQARISFTSESRPTVARPQGNINGAPSPRPRGFLVKRRNTSQDFFFLQRSKRSPNCQPHFKHQKQIAWKCLHLLTPDLFPMTQYQLH